MSVGGTGRTQKVYNLTIADFHTYFVGEEQLFVHNCGEQGPRFYRGAKREEAIDANRKSDGSIECECCGKELTEEKGLPDTVTVDHKVAYKSGGKTDTDNAALACKSCNSSKGAKELGTEWTPPKERD